VTEVRLADQLRYRVFDDDVALGTAAADDAVVAIRAAIDQRGVANIMLATGNSQFAFLAALVDRHDVAWDKVTAFHMDEYAGLSPSHPASFQRYMRERVAAHLPLHAFHYLHGDAPDANAEARRYADLLRAHPLDLCCLGIGENGHLAFNDPPVADFDDSLDVKIVELDRACREQQVGEGHFATVADVPTHAITVTIPALLRAGAVLAIVPEMRKATPVRAALEGPITTACPASILRRQPNATLFLDRASASLLSAAV
jgi:glucosamine-6-phosphate deaminase